MEPWSHIDWEIVRGRPSGWRTSGSLLYGSLGRALPWRICALPNRMERLKSRLASAHVLQVPKFGNISLKINVFEFLVLQELGWPVMVMRNPEARQTPIMGGVSFQINFKEYHAI